MGLLGAEPLARDPAAAWIRAASGEATAAWEGVRGAVDSDLPEMGLAAGERPAADVEVLASAAASCEYLVATRMAAAAGSGCLPLGERGGVLAARGWSLAMARRLARSGLLALEHESIAAAWGAGLITSEHVDPIARLAERFTAEELAAVVAELGPHWGSWSPASISRFVTAAERMLHPAPDPSSAEADAYETRSLSFAITADEVLLTGALPRVEGELVIAAIDALAERLRSTADHVPAAARRADALVELVNTAHAAGALPTRGGLPVSLSVTLDHTSLGDPLWTTSRGHLLTRAEARWTGCDAQITPILTDRPGSCPTPVIPSDPGQVATGPAGRIAALAALMFDTRIPLAVGRTSRTATPPNAARWRSETADVRFLVVASPPRPARSTTWSNGPTAAEPTSTISSASAGPTTARSTCGCGPSPPGDPPADHRRSRAPRRALRNASSTWSPGWAAASAPSTGSAGSRRTTCRWRGPPRRSTGCASSGRRSTRTICSTPASCSPTDPPTSAGRGLSAFRSPTPRSRSESE